MKLLLLLALFAPEYRWVSVKQSSYQVDKRFVNAVGNVMGGYYQPIRPTHQPVPMPNLFTASCWDTKPVEFPTEPAAVKYVEACSRF